jgi:predicted lipoprotein with Yx(FWY)xxD motif
MRHTRRVIAITVIVAALGATGIAAAITASGSTTPTVAAGTTTIHSLMASVSGKTEAILVDSKGLPLYIYKSDTPTKSFVSGQLASIWPPLVSTRPTIVGATGKLSVTNDANGPQVAYNGHFLYTFVGDAAGHVTGQGVQNFFVATPGLTAIGAGSSASSTPAPAASSGGGYGY